MIGLADPTFFPKERSNRIRNHDLIVVLDPAPVDLGYVQHAIDTIPLQRGVVAFTEEEVRQDLDAILGAKRVPILGSGGDKVNYRYIRKLFPFLLRPDGNEEVEGIDAITEALSYPDVVMHKDRLGPLKIVEPDTVSTTATFRRYLVEDRTDEAWEEGGAQSIVKR